MSDISVLGSTLVGYPIATISPGANVSITEAPAGTFTVASALAGTFVTNTGAPVAVATTVPATLATITIPSAGTYLVYAACNAPITNTTDCILDVLNGVTLLGRGVGAGFANAGIVAIGACISCVPVVFAGGEVLIAQVTFASAGSPYNFVGSITAMKIA